METLTQLSTTQIRHTVETALQPHKLRSLRTFPSEVAGATKFDSDFDLLLEIDSEATPQQRKAIRRAVRDAFWHQHHLAIDLILLSPSQTQELPLHYGSLAREIYLNTKPL